MRTAAKKLIAGATKGSDNEPTRFRYLSREEQPPDDVQRGGHFSLREVTRGDACDLPAWSGEAVARPERRDRAGASGAAGYGAFARAVLPRDEAHHSFRRPLLAAAADAAARREAARDREGSRKSPRQGR